MATDDSGAESLALYGDKSKKSPVQDDTNFAYRSITKSLVGTVILQLVDEGELSLNSPVSDFVDGVPGGTSITIGQLASMRSGLANYSAQPALGEMLSADPSRAVATSELLALAFAEPPVFAPGTAYQYSNTNTLLLGEVIEAVTEVSWQQAVKDRLLTPLGMSSVQAGFADAARDATGYQLENGKVFEALPVVAPEWFGAAGGLTGDVRDLATWGEALGSGSMLSAETQQLRLGSLGDTSDDPASPEYDRYGLAIGEIDGWIGHTGNGLGFQSLVMHRVSDGVTVAILINGTGENSDLPADIFKQLEALF